MSGILVYTKSHCPYCKAAKALLEARGATFREIEISHDVVLRREMIARSGRHTVPQVFIGDRHVGGFDDLSELDREGGLAPLLAALGTASA
ncbi:glutaredoxin 3 [Stappia sp. MMSF_3263]|uniref:glutaredoxin 3 n=1 Tax=Stappia sp. MMSF_3263 TaxID=3046693 RepID=UPI00274020EB|nr:glutaredoxin 3 [Stappia sp. MMSF_3263]